MLKIDVPTGSTFYWNPYSPKFFTIVSPNASFPNSSRCSDCDSSAEESSINPVEDDECDLGWATIAAVRTEITDANIQNAIARLPYRTLQAVLTVLQSSPSLLTELCEKDRGNIVSHVVGAMGGDACQEIINYVVDNARRLATNQSGCIAFTRIFDSATKAQRECMSRSVVPDLEELVLHPYGNFVVSRVLQERQGFFYEYLADSLEHEGFLMSCVESKFGSHVYEAFVKNAPAPLLFRVARVFLSNPENVLQIATSKVANYTLQSTLKTMLIHDPHHELSRWALETVPKIVANTQYALNINRSLGFRPTSTVSSIHGGEQRSPKCRR